MNTDKCIFMRGLYVTPLIEKFEGGVAGYIHAAMIEYLVKFVSSRNQPDTNAALKHNFFRRANMFKLVVYS
jgi:hypothetical protein